MNDFTRLFDLPYYQQANFPKQDCLNKKANGIWSSYNTQDVIDNMNKVSMALLASGIKKGDVISIVSDNRPQWNFVDLGSMQIGGITVPIYPTISDEDYTFIMNNAETQLLFVSSKELYERMKILQPSIPSLKEIFTFNDVAGAPHWDEFLKRAEGFDAHRLKQASDDVSEKDIACMIYTSGTTGFPKGVMLSHFNICENLKSVSDILPINETHKALSFLPLNHVFEKLVVYAYLMKGISVYYAESMDTIGENMREVKPHFFTCVPRLLEKVYERILAKGLELKGVKRALFFWALNLGEQWDNQKDLGWWYYLKLKIARKLIFSKWLDALGGNVFAIISGSAPLNPKLGRVFTAAGIVIMEGYGLTETSPVLTVNRYNLKENILGTVGLVIHGVEVKLADDGEILARGNNIMAGYYKLPDETARVIDRDGWFQTGDIGVWVNEKFLKITDRKKELLKTSGGKYVAPQPIENKFKESHFIEQMMVAGDGKKFVSALIVPSFQYLKSWAEKNGITFASNEEAANHPRIIEKFKEVVDEKNTNFGHTEQIKKFKLVAEEWTIQGGQLTPTMKLKRKVIRERYKDLIEAMYLDEQAKEIF
ncbi:MAG TPA: long-chain fatty acid--CoA ligase [Chitinophagales bacterium]|nr:long-chain fatty acid--CoA ligase [Chitinophagales bacterium]